MIINKRNWNFNRFSHVCELTIFSWRRLLRNFLTNFDSSTFFPSAAAFHDISDSFIPKSSIVSVSCILRRSNSFISVCNLDFLTFFAPTCMLCFNCFLYLFFVSTSPFCKISISCIVERHWMYKYWRFDWLYSI